MIESTALPETKPQTIVTETVKSETMVRGDKPSNVESTLFGVSVRGWITFIITLTVCAMAFIGKDIKEPLYGSLMLVLGFYFGQAKPK